MKFARQIALSRSLSANRLRGKPPRTQTLVGGFGNSVRSNGPSSTVPRRPASDSPAWRRRSMEAEPNKRNCPDCSPRRMRSSMTPRRTSNRAGLRCISSKTTRRPRWRREVRPRVVELFKISRVFQIEIDAADILGLAHPRDGTGQCGLANLAWSNQGNCRENPKIVPDAGFQMSRNRCSHCKVVKRELVA